MARALSPNWLATSACCASGASGGSKLVVSMNCVLFTDYIRAVRGGIGRVLAKQAPRSGDLVVVGEVRKVTNRGSINAQPERCQRGAVRTNVNGHTGSLDRHTKEGDWRIRASERDQHRCNL